MANPTKPYVIWIDYGSDGWSPEECASVQEVEDFVLHGESNGYPFVITKLLDVRLMLDREIEVSTPDRVPGAPA